MAGHDVEYSTAEGNDYEQHEGTYKDFLRLVKWTSIIVVVTLAFLWVFIF
ncbi:MAG TPA: aa3-type cytochrome c oxidase subunit IV [Xanthobacteraceae bacterium]|nr:aa3-type cytochrome c oxidase subunit IV [Xanthobacteraceae bacterium]